MDPPIARRRSDKLLSDGAAHNAACRPARAAVKPTRGARTRGPAPRQALSGVVRMRCRGATRPARRAPRRGAVLAGAGQADRPREDPDRDSDVRARPRALHDLRDAGWRPQALYGTPEH